MAKIQCMITFLTLFTCQMLYGEGRHIRSLNGVDINHIKGPSLRGIRKLSTLTEKSLNSKKSSPDFSETIIHNHKSRGSNDKANSFWVGIQQSSCLGENCPEDFKPTAPGKSPGAGHSFVTSTEDKFSPNHPTKNSENLWNSLEATSDDFRETTPAGHAKLQEDFPQTPNSFFSDSELVSTNDFKPTAPGSSPGAGHPMTEKDDVNCLRVICTDDFRPTTPGDSPGAGHPVKSNSGSIASEQVMQSGVTDPQAGGLDDHRPTKPGQSPGAGHAVLNKREPNP